MERKTVLRAGARATSQQEITEDRLASLPLISNGPYPMMMEIEMIWKYSKQR